MLFSRPCQLPFLNMVRNWPSPACEFNQEDSKSEYSSCFFLRSQCFSWHFSINLLFSQVCRLPSLSRQREYGPSPPSPVHELNGEGGKSEYSSCFYFFPTIPNVFHGNFQLTCCSVSTLPQSTEGIRAHCCHPPLASWIEKAATVRVLLVLIFSPPLSIFLTPFFTIKFLFSRPCRLHAHTRQRE